MKRDGSKIAEGSSSNPAGFLIELDQKPRSEAFKTAQDRPVNPQNIAVFTRGESVGKGGVECSIHSGGTSKIAAYSRGCAKQSISRSWKALSRISTV
jgi:hypothetical protein